MVASDDVFNRYIEDPDLALKTWYASYVSPDADPDLILTSGDDPDPNNLRDFFDRWFSKFEGQLRVAICQGLRYERLGSGSKQLGEVALVAAVAALLAHQSGTIPVDPVATAAVLVTRRKLDKLCAVSGGDE
ncbi:hypothetical protein [Actinoplanes sp. HUAS TT8]|uniref:hypothetical protein n=1 Tax=Actinoplanes sp. HUAS TT8 TaxID=3447453 RepID=UPI003F51F855